MHVTGEVFAERIAFSFIRFQRTEWNVRDSRRYRFILNVLF